MPSLNNERDRNVTIKLGKGRLQAQRRFCWLWLQLECAGRHAHHRDLDQLVGRGGIVGPRSCRLGRPRPRGAADSEPIRAGAQLEPAERQGATHGAELRRCQGLRQ